MEYTRVGLTPHLQKQLKDLAHKDRTSMSEYMRNLLKAELRRRKKRAAAIAAKVPDEHYGDPDDDSFEED